MDDLIDYITYPIAKQKLADRLKATEDEIAQWVSIGAEQGGLNAYTKNKFDTPRLFNYKVRDFIHDDNYIKPLNRLYFLPDDIGQFQPAKRYISRQALINRWTKHCGNEAQAIDFIEDRANESRLPEYHPIAGCVESEGELFRSGIFDFNDVQQIESRYFPELSDTVAEPDDTVVPSNDNVPITKQRKRLQPLVRHTNEGLELIYEMLEFYNIEYLDELSANKAWGKIVSGEFKHDLIKNISEAKKSIMLNGGEKLGKSDFSEKYRKRFK